MVFADFFVPMLIFLEETSIASNRVGFKAIGLDSAVGTHHAFYYGTSRPRGHVNVSHRARRSGHRQQHSVPQDICNIFSDLFIRLCCFFGFR